MVNEKQGKTYEVMPIYNRKLVRTVLRNIAFYRHRGKVSQRMSEAFKQYQERMNNKEVVDGTAESV